MKTLLFLLILLIPRLTMAQGQLKIELPGSQWLQKLKESTTATVSSQLGSSSNIGKTPKSEAGTFLKVSPQMMLEFIPSDKLVISPIISGEFKRFNEKDAANLGDEENAEVRIMGILFAESGDEWSLESGHARTKHRTPIINSDLTTTPLLQKYSENDLRASWTRIGETMETSFSISYKDQNHEIPLMDRGNEFKNDNEIMATEISWLKKFGKTFQLTVSSKLERKDYDFRPADFSDGAASDESVTTHPRLREESQEHTIGSSLRVDVHQLKLNLGYKLVKDRIFGGRDSRGLKPGIQLLSQWSDKMKTSLRLTARQNNFENFRVDPSLGSASDLRKEWDYSTSFTTEWALTKKFSVIGQWDYSRLVTNFANGTYTDHTLISGIQWKL